jgi:hypothetical protein
LAALAFFREAAYLLDTANDRFHAYVVTNLKADSAVQKLSELSRAQIVFPEHKVIGEARKS